MRIDMIGASFAEQQAWLGLRFFDSITNEEVRDVSACDTETGWRREYRKIDLEPNAPLKEVEVVGNPLRVERVEPVSGKIYDADMLARGLPPIKCEIRTNQKPSSSDVIVRW